MTNDNLLKELFKRKETLDKERHKLDEMIAFYRPETLSTPSQKIFKSPISKRNRKNGNTSKIYQIAHDLIIAQGYAPTDEIADLAKKAGIDEGHYSKKLTTQISGYMSRNKKFRSSDKGWLLK